MLSAFRAQPILELKTRDKSKIEALLVYGDKIFVGLNTGTLRVYRVHENITNDDAPSTPTKPKPADCLFEDEKFSKKPIQQLALVKEANLLISLSDGIVSIHDLQTYQLLERLDRTKGASCFAVTSNVVKDPETNVPGLVSRLAIAVKRKILFWTWQDMEQLPEISEITLEATIKSLNWVEGTRLIAGMDPGFSAVDVLTEAITPIYKQAQKTATADGNPGELAAVRFGAVSSSGMGYMGMGSWVPKPMAAPMSNKQVLLAKDVNTLFVDTDGNAIDRRQVPWAVAPEAIGYSYPYLLALLPADKGSLQIRNPDTLSLLQNIALPGANILHVPQPNISLAHAGKGFIVASDRTIWRMSALPYHTQLTELVESQRFDEAISLLKLLEDTLIDDKAGRIREIMTQKAISLFQQQKYRPALDLFIDAEASPDRVISLYPRVIAGDISSIPETPPDSEREGSEAHESKPGSINEVPKTPSKGMFGMLSTPRRGNGDTDTASIKSPTKPDTDTMSVRGGKQPPPKFKIADNPLEGEDLKLAVRCLCSFLAHVRTQLQKYISPDGSLKENPPTLDSETHRPVFHNLLSDSTSSKSPSSIDWQAELLSTAKLVDTTLFRSYMLAMPSLVGSLFRIDNFCDPDVVQTSLYSNERYSDLIDFLHGKKLHRQALEMLAKFGKEEADGEVPDTMRGPERTIGYLKQLPPDLVSVIIEFIHWPISVAPNLAMDVFLADTDNAERLPRDVVLKFLSDFSNHDLEISYLEHIIHELGERGGQFHQRLIDLYLIQLKSQDLPSSQQEEIRLKLESFLKQSKVYNKAKTFQQLPATNPLFYEIRALVLSAMGNHKQALSIYVFQIQSPEKAEDYCNKIYLEDHPSQSACLLDDVTLHDKPIPSFSSTSISSNHKSTSNNNDDDSNKPNIFAILLGLYLRPPPNETKRWPDALSLLSKHGARLPASSTLDLMPDDLPIASLHSYFLGRLRSTTTLLRADAITRQLESVRRIRAERSLLLGDELHYNSGGTTAVVEKLQGRNRRVRIDEESHCSVCGKRITPATAIKVYPDNEAIHYGCITKSGNNKSYLNGAGRTGSENGMGTVRKGWSNTANARRWDA